MSDQQDTPVSKSIRGLQGGGTAELWPVFREEDNIREEKRQKDRQEDREEDREEDIREDEENREKESREEEDEETMMARLNEEEEAVVGEAVQKIRSHFQINPHFEFPELEGWEVNPYNPNLFRMKPKSYRTATSQLPKGIRRVKRRGVPIEKQFSGLKHLRIKLRRCDEEMLQDDQAEEEEMRVEKEREDEQEDSGRIKEPLEQEGEETTIEDQEVENEEGEEEIPEEWAMAIEEAEWDYDPDYVGDNKEEEEENEEEKEQISKPKPGTSFEDDGEEAEEDRKEEEEDDRLMNVAKRPKKTRTGPTTRERKKCHICEILVVKLPRHLRKIHGFTKEKSLPNSKDKKRKICPEAGCGKAVLRLDTHLVNCHAAHRGKELHQKVIDTKKSATVRSFKKGKGSFLDDQ